MIITWCITLGAICIHIYIFVCEYVWSMIKVGDEFVLYVVLRSLFCILHYFVCLMITMVTARYVE